MRLDLPKHKKSTTDQLMLVGGIVLLLLLIMPSTGAIKRFLIDKGFVSQYTSNADKAKQIASSVAILPVNLLAAERQLPVVKIDIKYQDWQQLELDRNHALTHGVIAEERNEVNAAISFQGDNYQAKVRLQGDMVDHVDKPNRWSLKFSLKKKQAIFASRKFALVAPSVRVNQGPSLFTETMKIAGFDIIAPQNIPVKVVVNGSDWGVMMFEQSFSQDLLAVNNRTEGLITRLDMFSEQQRDDGTIQRVLKPRVLQRNTILANHALAKQRQIALTLLNDFLSGNRPASDVFDAERLGQYLATVDLWGAWHALTWNNWRWYYNPHIAKFEPIQSDVAVTPAAHIWLMKPPSHTFELSKAMLSDGNVSQQYQKAKRQLLTMLDNRLIPKLASFDQSFIRQLHSDSPLLKPFDLQVMRNQANCWQLGYDSAPCNALQEVSADLHKQMDEFTGQANWDLISRLFTDQQATSLQLFNNDKEPLTVKALEGIISNDEITVLDAINDELPITLQPGEGAEIPLPRHLLAVNVRASLASKSTAEFSFINDVAPLSFIPRGDPQPIPARYREFISASHNTWLFKPGTWQVDDYLVTPTNTRVIIPADTHLRFAQNAGLMVFGQLVVKGNVQEPVTFSKQANSSKWSGISVFASTTNTKHQVEHLQISYASSPKLGLWQPRGAIYFVSGRVHLNNIEISDNQSEDGLNIVNATIDVDGLTIRNALSDAFDCDFCRGELRNSYFSNIGFRSGGDGLDVSGSTLKLYNARFENVRDKAISGGERSNLHVINAHFDNVNFGLVSKDDTKIVAQQITATNVQHQALMSYSKKRIFGPAVLKVEQFQCADPNCNGKITAETGSRLFVNGLQVATQALDIKDMYNTVMKSDKPK